MCRSALFTVKSCWWSISSISLEVTCFFSDFTPLTHSEVLGLNQCGHPPKTKPFRTSHPGRFANGVCVLTHTGFHRVPGKVLATQRWIPGAQSPLANCTVWLRGFPDWPVFPLKPEQSRNNGLWWPDQRPCSKTSPYVACPRWESHSVPLAFISTMDRGLGGFLSNALIHNFRNSKPACLQHDIVQSVTLTDWPLSTTQYRVHETWQRTQTKAPFYRPLTLSTVLK